MLASPHSARDCNECKIFTEGVVCAKAQRHEQFAFENAKFSVLLEISVPKILCNHY
jgi:hypothetical protein